MEAHIVHHTITGLFSTCRTKLRAADAVAHLTWEGVTCEACLAPEARRRADQVLRNDIHNWGEQSAAWPFRKEASA